MSRSSILIVLATLWASLIAISFISCQITPPSGDGFTAGLNRVGGFLGWQLLAGLASVFIWRNWTAFEKLAHVLREDRL